MATFAPVLGGVELDERALRSALDWWREIGVDAPVREEPLAWLDRGRVARVPEPPAEAAPPAAPRLPDDLQALRAGVAEAVDLPFAAPGARRVLPTGDPTAGLMVIAGMPGADDLAAGAPLGGEAGRLFDRMLAAIGRSRQAIYLSPLSCHRCPSGRFSVDEERRCAELARRHVALAAPAALLLLGDAPCKQLLGIPLVRARGGWHCVKVDGGTVPAVATFAPDTLLAHPALKRGAWADLQRLTERCD